MSDKPKRPWFRFHLSTAIVSLILLGAFVGFNFQAYTTHIQTTRFSGLLIQNHPCAEFDDVMIRLTRGGESWYGWPFVARGPTKWLVLGILSNAAIGILFAAVVAMSLE